MLENKGNVYDTGFFFLIYFNVCTHAATSIERFAVMQLRS